MEKDQMNEGLGAVKNVFPMLSSLLNSKLDFTVKTTLCGQ